MRDLRNAIASGERDVIGVAYQSDHRSMRYADPFRYASRSGCVHDVREILCRCPTWKVLFAERIDAGSLLI